MTTLSVWDPFAEIARLRSVMDRLFDHAWLRTDTSPSGSAPYTFPLDLWERDDAFEARAFLPGLKSDEIDISVQGNTLSITAQRNMPEEHKHATWYLREFPYGRFYRQVTLPAEVQPEEVEARMEDGVLYLRLPKVAAARAHHIRINGRPEPKVIEAAAA